MRILWSVIVFVLVAIGPTKAQIQFPGADKHKGSIQVLKPVPPPKAGLAPGHNDPNDPQSRFLFGGKFGFGNLFNPCQTCNFQDPLFANECCLKGKRHCCQFALGFSGVGAGHVAPPHHIFPGFGGGGVGGIGGTGGHPPFGFTGFGGQPGFPGPGHFPGPGRFPVPGHFPGHPGIGGIPSVGAPGFHGGNFILGLKPGFCPEPGLFDVFTNRRSLTSDKDGASRPFTFRSVDDVKRREKRQEQKTKLDVPVPRNGSPQSRFFCRDKCFRDIDCPGNLKCCMDLFNCKICTRAII